MPRAGRDDDDDTATSCPGGRGGEDGLRAPPRCPAGSVCLPAPPTCHLPPAPRAGRAAQPRPAPAIWSCGSAASARAPAGAPPSVSGGASEQAGPAPPSLSAARSAPAVGLHLHFPLPNTEISPECPEVMQDADLGSEGQRGMERGAGRRRDNTFPALPPAGEVGTAFTGHHLVSSGAGGPF